MYTISIFQTCTSCSLQSNDTQRSSPTTAPFSYLYRRQLSAYSSNRFLLFILHERGERMAFYFLKRAYETVCTWWQTGMIQDSPRNGPIKHMHYGRLIDQVPLASWTFTSKRFVPEEGELLHNNVLAVPAPRRQTIPRHVRMDMRPWSVLLCAECGAIVSPWSRNPCHVPGCGSELRIKAVCNCIHLPLDEHGIKHHRVYLRRCEVHDH
jgi:hypothetical protein